MAINQPPDMFGAHRPFRQIPVTPEGLRHQFAPAVKNLGAEGNFCLGFSLIYIDILFKLR
jgi:hypothetical protein